MDEPAGLCLSPSHHSRKGQSKGKVGGGSSLSRRSMVANSALVPALMSLSIRPALPLVLGLCLFCTRGLEFSMAPLRPPAAHLLGCEMPCPHGMRPPLMFSGCLCVKSRHSVLLASLWVVGRTGVNSTRSSLSGLPLGSWLFSGITFLKWLSLPWLLSGVTELPTVPPLSGSWGRFLQEIPLRDLDRGEGGGGGYISSPFS